MATADKNPPIASPTRAAVPEAAVGSRGVPQGSRTAGRVWIVRAVSTLSIAATALVLLIVAGALFPRTPVLGSTGTIFETILSLHITIVAVIAFLLALWMAAWGGKRGSMVMAAFAAVAIVGSLVPVMAFVRAASRYNANLSWADHLHVTARGPQAVPNRSEIYAAMDGKSLYADIYLPANSSATSPSAAVLMIHGGGYSAGARSDARNWDRWLAARGYTVFDIDYRLDPPPTWNQAGQDAACAMAWIGSHAAEYHIAADRVLIAGQSAGAELSLQVAYGLGDGSVASSCGGAVPQPRAVFALYPPEDLALTWDMNTGVGPVRLRTMDMGYIGGSPQQFPERYRAVSPTFHVRSGLPPTLIAAGEADHLVPFEGHRQIIAKLSQAGVPNLLVTIPYSDHSYDVAWGSLGTQITRQALADFLIRYLPVTETHSGP